MMDDSTKAWVQYTHDIHESKHQDLEVRNQDLEAKNQRLEAKNQRLEAKNRKLKHGQRRFTEGGSGSQWLPGCVRKSLSRLEIARAVCSETIHHPWEPTHSWERGGKGSAKLVVWYEAL